jgi:hypothetical protein
MDLVINRGRWIAPEAIVLFGSSNQNRRRAPQPRRAGGSIFAAATSGKAWSAPGNPGEPEGLNQTRLACRGSDAPRHAGVPGLPPTYDVDTNDFGGVEILPVYFFTGPLPGFVTSTEPTGVAPIQLPVGVIAGGAVLLSL